MKIFIRNIILICFLTTGISAAFADNIDTTLPLPGGTLGNVKLQADTLVPVYASASQLVKNCKDLSISNTKVTKQPYNLKTQNGSYTAGRWEELWTVDACGEKVDVPIEFILDPTGATYVITQNEVRLQAK